MLKKKFYNISTTYNSDFKQTPTEKETQATNLMSNLQISKQISNYYKLNQQISNYFKLNQQISKKLTIF